MKRELVTRADTNPSFGYNDGVSQPAIDGIDKALKGQDTIEQGVILCNRGSNAGRRPDWMTDGSFMCFRKLEQNVPAWNKFLVDASNTLGTFSDQLGSRLIGRWKSGSYTLSPYVACVLQLTRGSRLPCSTLT
jgi:deferrochelatase/peroxidase EfeB